MNKHITILFLLSLAFTVLSVPVATTKPAAKQGKCSGRKRSPSVSSVSSGSHHPSHAPALQKRSPEPDDSSLEHLYRRAGTGIQLCGMNFRGKAASNCAESQGFINGVWKDHGKFETKGLECDHILELQLIKAALEKAGFCNGWETIQTKWAEKDPSGKEQNLRRMKDMFDAGLKRISNPPSDMMWVDGDFNGKKRAFFAAKIRATPTTTAAPANIKAYFNANVKAKAASVAEQVDKAASRLLEQVVEAATEGYSCDPENPHDYVIALRGIAFPSNPVSDLWEKVEVYL